MDESGGARFNQAEDFGCFPECSLRYSDRPHRDHVGVLLTEKWPGATYTIGHQGWVVAVVASQPLPLRQPRVTPPLCMKGSYPTEKQLGLLDRASDEVVSSPSS